LSKQEDVSGGDGFVTMGVTPTRSTPWRTSARWDESRFVEHDGGHRDISPPLELSQNPSAIRLRRISKVSVPSTVDTGDEADMLLVRERRLAGQEAANRGQPRHDAWRGAADEAKPAGWDQRSRQLIAGQREVIPCEDTALVSERRRLNC
jgi:hypothetical protein